MSDNADLAQEYEEVALIVARINHNYSALQRLPRTGFCHYCKEPIEKEKLFCDADCRDDYEWEQKGKGRN